MPLQRADLNLPGVGTTFIAKEQTVEETQRSANGLVTTRTRGHNAAVEKDLGKNQNAGVRFGVTEKREKVSDAAGRSLADIRTVTVNSFDRTGNVIASFQTRPFGTLSKVPNKLDAGALMPAAKGYQANSTVVTSDGNYGGWNGAQVKVTYAGSGDNARMKRVEVFG